MKIRTAGAGIVAAVVLLASCTTSAVEPAAMGEVTTVSGASGDTIKDAVLSSLRYREWTILEAGDGFFLAKASHKDRSVVTRVSYTEDTYKFDYVSAENISGGADSGTYQHWIYSLDADIRAGLGLPALPG